MKLTARTRRSWPARIALGLVLAATAAPVAQAQSSQSDVPPVGPEFATWTVNWTESAAEAGPEFPTYPINWAQPVRDGAPQFPPSQINWAQPSTEAPGTPAAVPGFDYRDAGIGAAIALGAALLAAAGFLALRRSRGPASLA